MVIVGRIIGSGGNRTDTGRISDVLVGNERHCVFLVSLSSSLKDGDLLLDFCLLLCPILD